VTFMYGCDGVRRCSRVDAQHAQHCLRAIPDDRKQSRPRVALNSCHTDNGWHGQGKGGTPDREGEGEGGKGAAR